MFVCDLNTFTANVALISYPLKHFLSDMTPIKVTKIFRKYPLYRLSTMDINRRQCIKNNLKLCYAQFKQKIKFKTLVSLVCIPITIRGKDIRRYVYRNILI